WDESRIRRRARQVMDAPTRLRSEIKGWLRSTIAPGLFLDMGCGAGVLLAAACAEGYHGIGIDVSLVWLIAAHRLLSERGCPPVLAAALGEALPLPDRSLSAVVALDVIEHVTDAGRCLGEIDRVTVSRGRIALATPNRFSLSAEPHVFVWGV